MNASGQINSDEKSEIPNDLQQEEKIPENWDQLSVHEKGTWVAKELIRRNIFPAGYQFVGFENGKMFKKKDTLWSTTLLVSGNQLLGLVRIMDIFSKSKNFNEENIHFVFNLLNKIKKSNSNYDEYDWIRDLDSVMNFIIKRHLETQCNPSKISRYPHIYKNIFSELKNHGLDSNENINFILKQEKYQLNGLLNLLRTFHIMEMKMKIKNNTDFKNLVTWMNNLEIFYNNEGDIQFPENLKQYHNQLLSFLFLHRERSTGYSPLQTIILSGHPEQAIKVFSFLEEKQFSAVPMPFIFEFENMLKPQIIANLVVNILNKKINKKYANEDEMEKDIKIISQLLARTNYKFDTSKDISIILDYINNITNNDSTITILENNHLKSLFLVLLKSANPKNLQKLHSEKTEEEKEEKEEKEESKESEEEKIKEKFYKFIKFNSEEEKKEFYTLQAKFHENNTQLNDHEINFLLKNIGVNIKNQDLNVIVGLDIDIEDKTETSQEKSLTAIDFYSNKLGQDTIESQYVTEIRKDLLRYMDHLNNSPNMLQKATKKELIITLLSELNRNGWEAMKNIFDGKMIEELSKGRGVPNMVYTMFGRKNEPTQREILCEAITTNLEALNHIRTQANANVTQHIQPGIYGRGTES